MDQQAFDAARAAYQKGDWASVVAYVGQAKRPGEAFGAADHLKGNALMKMGRYEEAAAAYEEALVDTAYGKRGEFLRGRQSLPRDIKLRMPCRWCMGVRLSEISWVVKRERAQTYS